MEQTILRVAVPSPLRRLFDYLPPQGEEGPFRPGQRVRVPFGRRRVVGVVWACEATSDVPADRLRHALEVLDPEPVLPAEALAFIQWASAYYLHAPGDAIASALPGPLREGRSPNPRRNRRWFLLPEGEAVSAEELSRAPRQAELLEALRAHPEGADGGALDGLPHWRETMRRLEAKGWVEGREGTCLPAPGEPEPGPALNAGQAAAVEAVAADLDRFDAFLLDGVTGSGKTEVYLALVERTVAAGRQALVLVPEIGLTPQLVRRFRRRLPVPVAVLHSGLADGERLCAWAAARDGEAPVVIGTRSAVFVPLARPGLVVVDEEHDPSFKQQEGFRYSGRDLAVVRAQRTGVPVVLGSATPSLESLQNARDGRYRRLELPERTGEARHPPIRLLDLRRKTLDGGLSEPLLQAMQRHLDDDGQVLLFLNRRGYAPALLCHECGWLAECRRCDARLTYHRAQGRLRCHHCGAERPVDRQCGGCGGLDLRPVGQGTEQLEEVLARRFPDQGVVRIDRDSTRRKGAMESLLAQARTGEGRILIGTQMLAKGHHLPGITLVGIVDADQGLFSADFRAGERLAQLVVQVAGRAGRADKPGEVLIQTHQPDHPLLQGLVASDYAGFAELALAEREQAALPPFSRLALLRADATEADAPWAFLEEAYTRAEAVGTGPVMLLGPAPAPMERRAGRYRAQLLLQAPARGPLHGFLERWLPELEGLKAGRKVRWSLDVDPMEMF